jgi:hypothetical protein
VEFLHLFGRPRFAKRRTCASTKLHVEPLESRELLTVLQPQFILLPQSEGNKSTVQTTNPAGIYPAQIRSLYGFDQISFKNGAVPADGTGTTIAIVDPNNDPNVAADLNTFDQQYSWTAIGSTLYQQYGAASTFLTVVNQTGGSTLPKGNRSNAEETALDVEWAHAIAPGAKILLVEATNDTGNNLFIAAAYAASQPGVVAVSMSWGASEFSGENGPGGFDATYFANHPGVTFVAASGDSGAPPIYPAISPDVLAVGGTSLSLSTAGNVLLSESGWGDVYGSSGGGISSFESQPSFQNNLTIDNGSTPISADGLRANPDIAYDASPASGFAVYNSYSFPTAPWQVFGGTSDGAPQMSALIAIADQGRALAGMGSLNGSTQTLPILYSLANSGFKDITSGTSLGTPNYSASPGYDLVTGLGVPIPDQIVGGLFDVKFNVTAGPSTVAGAGFDITVQAVDAFGNPASGYSGTVQFTSSDGAALLPVDTTLTNGTGVFSVTLNTVGTQTVIVSDSGVGTITGGVATLDVTASSASHFVINSPGTTTAGSPFAFTVIAEDPSGNTVTSYNGVITFTSSDNAATLPAPVMLNGGSGIFSATLQTLGSQTLTATDTANLTGSAILNVEAVVVAPTTTHFVISAPGSTTAGLPIVFEVMAEDQFNNISTSYAGTVSLSSSDSGAAFSSSTSVLSNGIGFFAATLKTAGNQVIIASDTATSSITGSSNAIAVSASAATHLVVTVAPLTSYPGLSSAYPTAPGVANSFAATGSPVVFTVEAEDWYGNVSPSYSGTVAFTASDTSSNAVLPASSTLAGGVGVFSATLATAGNQFITVTDTSSPGITGSSKAITVRGLVVTSFSPTPSGFIITFDKPFNPSSLLMYSPTTSVGEPDDILLTTTNSQVSVRGSVLINSTDTGITFVKTDNITASGTFNPANGLLAAGNYTLTLRSFGFSVSAAQAAGVVDGFQDALGSALDGADSGGAGNFQIKFSVSAPPVAVGIPDFARGPSNTDAIFLPSTLTNGATFQLSYTNPNAIPAVGTAATIAFSTNAATLQNNIQAALSSGGLAAQVGVNGGANATPNSVVIVTNDTSTGANILVTFQSALAQSTTELLTSNTPGVTIAPATINAANNSPTDGLPIALSSGLGVTSGSFTLQYNPSLLSISGAVSKIAGASFVLVSNDTVAGTAVLSFSSATPISSSATAVTLGSLLATVPFSAAPTYGAQQLLHFSGEQLNGTAGPIAVTNQDGVQVAAYFGDVTDTGGPLSLSDATALATVASAIPNTTTQTIPGFAAFPDVDPAIIGDVSLQGSVTSTDAGAMIQQVSGEARITIPYAPIGLSVTPLIRGSTLALASGSSSVDKTEQKTAASMTLTPSHTPDTGLRTPNSGQFLSPVGLLNSVHDLALLQTAWTAPEPQLQADHDLFAQLPHAPSGLLGSPFLDAGGDATSHSFFEQTLADIDGFLASRRDSH